MALSFTLIISYYEGLFYTNLAEGVTTKRNRRWGVGCGVWGVVKIKKSFVRITARKDLINLYKPDSIVPTNVAKLLFFPTPYTLHPTLCLIYSSFVTL